MIDELSDLKSSSEKAEYLQSIVIARATGGETDDEYYKNLRKEFLDSNYKNLLPLFIKSSRNLEQLWQFIKGEYGTYAERRSYIGEKFRPLFDILELSNYNPAEDIINSSLNQFDADGVYLYWRKALERKNNDPDGSITIARTMIETVCKNILDKMEIEYASNIDLSELYKLTAKELNLMAEQHTEKVFKQILGGCSAIVNGLGSLRNKLGDAYGQGIKKQSQKLVTQS